jgi:hypothetical protein
VVRPRLSYLRRTTCSETTIGCVVSLQEVQLGLRRERGGRGRARASGTVAGQAAAVEGSAIEGVTVLETPLSVLDRGP